MLTPREAAEQSRTSFLFLFTFLLGSSVPAPHLVTLLPEPRPRRLPGEPVSATSTACQAPAPQPCLLFAHPVTPRALTGLSVHLTQTAAPARGSQSLLFLPLPSLGRAPPALTSAAARRALRAQAAHLGARGQQQLHALRLALQAGGVQGGDGVHRDLVDAGAALDQLLQPQRLALLGGLVHGRALHPEAWRGEDRVLSPGCCAGAGQRGGAHAQGPLGH